MLSYSLNVSIIQLFLEVWGAPWGPFVYHDRCCLAPVTDWRWSESRGTVISGLLHTWARPSVFQILKISIFDLHETPFACVVAVTFSSRQVVVEKASGSVSLRFCLCLCFCSRLNGPDVLPLVGNEIESEWHGECGGSVQSLKVLWVM